MLPSYREIPSGSTVQLAIRVPRQVKTIVPGAPLKVSSVPGHVRLELGWSDEPLALHPGEGSLCTYEAGKRIQSRERGVLRASSR
jgi:hypothetical protein